MRAKENLVHPDKESSVRAEKGPISANRLGAPAYVGGFAAVVAPPGSVCLRERMASRESRTSRKLKRAQRKKAKTTPARAEPQWPSGPQLRRKGPTKAAKATAPANQKMVVTASRASEASRWNRRVK
ncbi:hypothetical protein P8C59_005852 [Phyllachora maydis]|uniref:Uncharacterized protein n=1 Tax=Phyllachora maydis TaxID=1825666 RepID=A0AAD9I693_9PEZI|nr:hypothetical protein P8C59_005852 [Phyllachora maydis]